MRRLLAVIAVLGVVFALRASAPVTLPLAFGLFLIALFWPLQSRLQRRLPTWGAMLLTLAALVVVAWAFTALLWEVAGVAAERAPAHAPELRRMLDQARAALGRAGIEVAPGDVDGAARAIAERAGRSLAGVAGGLVLVVAYFALGLLEVLDFRRKLSRASPRAGPEWLEPLRRIATEFQRYMVVRTLVGMISGIGTAVAAWAVGVDLVLVWGALAFLLNYIPTLGSIAAVIPPVLFALVQGGWSTGLIALAAIGGVQLVTGNTIDPLLQGRWLRLSPLVVLLSVALWGWVWGVAGAFLGVPITVAITIATARSPSTRWIAVLLSDVDGGADAPPPGRGDDAPTAAAG